MKSSAIAAIGMAFLVLSGSVASAQTPVMYTLGDIYYYLIDGTEAAEGGYPLEPPPGSVPGDTRFKTLKEIYQDTKALFDRCNALPSDVTEGKLFFSAEAGNWGARTGTVYRGRGLLKTGQTFSYYPDDDGGYQKGADYDYTDNGDGTITDNFTGLIWPKEGDGPGCYDGSFSLAWSDAIDWAEGLTFAGYSDWRLPNARELYSLIREGGSGAKIDQSYFPNTRSHDYRTSTTCPYLASQALLVGFNSAYLLSSSKTYVTYLRAVRGGN